MKKSAQNIQISVSKKDRLIVSGSYCSNMYELWNRDMINTKFPSNLNNTVAAYYKGDAFTKHPGTDAPAEDSAVKSINNVLDIIKNAHIYSEAQEVYISPVIYTFINDSGDETSTTILISRDEKSICFIKTEYAEIFKALRWPMYTHHSHGLVWCGCVEEDAGMVAVYAAAVVRQDSLSDPLLRQVVNVMKERIDKEAQDESNSNLAGGGI